MFYTSFRLIWYATWPPSEKKCFDLLTPSSGRWCVKGKNICLHDVLCFIAVNLICNMTTFRKENKNWHFDPKYVYGQNVCYHVIVCFILLNLYATWLYAEKVVFWQWPKPLGPPSYNPAWFVSYLLFLCLHANFLANKHKWAIKEKICLSNQFAPNYQNLSRIKEVILSKSIKK